VETFPAAERLQNVFKVASVKPQVLGTIAGTRENCNQSAAEPVIVNGVDLKLGEWGPSRELTLTRIFV
jgi:hypothetical protein